MSMRATARTRGGGRSGGGSDALLCPKTGSCHGVQSETDLSVHFPPVTPSQAVNGGDGA